jgi:hypothetical protein
MRRKFVFGQTCHKPAIRPFRKADKLSPPRYVGHGLNCNTYFPCIPLPTSTDANMNDVLSSVHGSANSCSSYRLCLAVSYAMPI